MSKQGVLLLSLMGLWAALIYWQWFTTNEPPRVPLTNISGAKVSRPEPAVPPEWVLERPSGARESPTVPKRNLFAPLNEREEQVMFAKAQQVKRLEDAHKRTLLEAAPASLFQTESAPVPRISPQEAAEMAAWQEREQRIAKLREQASQYRLLGLAEQSGVKQAFIGKGTDIYVVRQGDQLDGLFMISIVDAGEVKIRDAEYHLEHTIKITKAAGPS
ncbi:MAG: hypothetical protein JJE16_16885 [Nitrospiraceae bacterium]|nr:hypothetical protein [Nitrospiraceae bacterium]